jgi:hypothetical protein
MLLFIAGFIAGCTLCLIAFVALLGYAVDQ